MRKLRNKYGFTLVECVVAMAILAIMTLLVAMMMQAIVGLRNQNRNTEKGIDDQAALLAQDGNLNRTEEAITADIAIDGIVISGSKKISYDGADVQIGALKYDVGEMVTAAPEETEPGETTPPVTTDPDDESGPVFGAAKVDGQVTITETKKESEFDSNDYCITWDVRYRVSSYSPQQGLKVIMPEKIKKITGKGIMPEKLNVEVHAAKSSDITHTENTFRIGLGDGQEIFTSTDIEAQVTFYMSKDDYAEYDSLMYFFTGQQKGQNINSVSLKIKP